MKILMKVLLRGKEFGLRISIFRRKEQLILNR